MSSVFKIYSPEDCDFYYDGELQGHIEGNSDRSFRFEVERKGVYRLKFVNSEYKSELIEKVSIDADEEREVELDFSEVNEPVIQERERIISAIEHDYEVGKRLPKEIISVISNNGLITIPKGVRKIGNRAFEGLCYFLTSITIPDSVIEIGKDAFCMCGSLTSIAIPDSVTKIGKDAFRYCRSLTCITIPDSVNEIEAGAFSDCSGLTAFYGKYASSDNRCLIKNGKLLAFAPYDITKYTIPNNATEIGAGAFSGCSRLTSITIPDSVNEIEAGAFSDCSGLTAFYGKYASSDNRCIIKNGRLLAFAPYDITNYTIPNIVIKIGKVAFRYCRSLTSITIPNSVNEIEAGAFTSCEGLISIIIPNSVTKIGHLAFSNCISLISITIPDSVTEIGGSSFYRCISLISVYCQATTPLNIDYLLAPFIKNASDLKIYVPKSDGSTVLEAYKSAGGWKDYADIIEEYDFDNE